MTVFRVHRYLNKAIIALEAIEKEEPRVSPLINEIAKLKESAPVVKSNKNIIEEYLSKVNYARSK